MKRKPAVKALRFGVIGSGGRGSLGRNAHDPANGCAVVACCDVRDEALAKNREWYGDGVLTTKDYRDLLDSDLDAVFVCSPDYLHEEHVVAALDRGLAVYAEKPLAITLKGCDRILRRNRKAGGRLFVGHNMRYMSIFRRMKALIDVVRSA